MRYAFLTAIFGLAVFSFPAYSAPMPCSAREDVLSQLAAKFHEAPTNGGITNAGGILEVTRSEDGATWTVIVHMPNGSTCLIAAGEGWRDYKDVAFPAVDPGDPL
jgi:hypothetical protein